MENQMKKRPAGYVPVPQKICYALAAGGGNITTQIIGVFAASYLTDSVGIAAASVATMMLVCRVFDVFSDFFMGAIVDRTRTRFGKARPYLAISTPLVIISIFLFFSVPGSLSSGGKLVWAYIMYVFVNAIATSCFFVPHTALQTRMTPNGLERQKTASMVQVVNQLSSLAVSTFWVPLTLAIGYQGTAAVYGIAAGALILTGFFGTREAIEDSAAAPKPSASDATGDAATPAADASVHAPAAPSLGAQLSCLVRNRYFWLETALFCLLLIHNAGFGTILPYYCNNIVARPEFVAVLMACYTLPALAMNFVLPLIVSKIGRRAYLVTGSCVVIVMSVLMGFFASSVVAVCVFFAVKSFFLGGMFGCAFAQTGDVVDFGERKSGLRTEGLVMSGVSIGQKLGLGLGPALCGWIIAAGGYDGLASAQTESALSAIRFSFSYLAAIIGAVMLVVTFLLDVEKHTGKREAE